MNADGSEVTKLTTNPADDYEPVWSPDGGKIAFVSNRDGNSEIYVMSTDGSGQTNLTNNTDEEGCPIWSPDGKKIAYLSSYAEWEQAIYVMNSDGSEQIKLIDNHCGGFSWRP